jgi:putative transposase
MPQSLASLNIHLVFSTKNRVPMILDAVRDDLHGYMAGVLKGQGCAPVLIHSVDDHVHMLFDLSRTIAVSLVVQEVKRSSSVWMKEQGRPFASFGWQAGYGAFAVGRPEMAVVVRYIANQAEHHRTKTFQDEYREFLERHQIVYDERYVWD